MWGGTPCLGPGFFRPTVDDLMALPKAARAPGDPKAKPGPTGQFLGNRAYAFRSATQKEVDAMARTVGYTPYPVGMGCAPHAPARPDCPAWGKALPARNTVPGDAPARQCAGGPLGVACGFARRRGFWVPRKTQSGTVAPSVQPYDGPPVGEEGCPDRLPSLGVAVKLATLVALGARLAANGRSEWSVRDDLAQAKKSHEAHDKARRMVTAMNRTPSGALATALKEAESLVKSAQECADAWREWVKAGKPGPLAAEAALAAAGERAATLGNKEELRERRWAGSAPGTPHAPAAGWAYNAGTAKATHKRVASK